MQFSENVKLSHNKSWRFRGGMEHWASILTVTFDTATTTQLSALHVGHNLPPRKFLGTHFCWGWVDPRSTECEQKE